jgi:hypothetical protein
MITAHQITSEHCIDCLMLRNTVILKKDCGCKRK